MFQGEGSVHEAGEGQLLAGGDRALLREDQRFTQPRLDLGWRLNPRPARHESHSR
jgi:hypothetical protein